MTAYAITIDHRDTDQVFSYYHADKMLHFNVTLLARLHAQRMRSTISLLNPLFYSECALFRIAMDIGKAEYDLCMAHRGIEEPKVASLNRERIDEPGYVAVFDEDRSFTIVDGHHRLVRRYREGKREMDFWIAPEAIWKHCLIEYTKAGEELLAANMPPKVENPEVLPTRVRLIE